MRALWIVPGIAVWALHFTLAYGFAAAACARGYAHTVPWGVGALSAVATVLMVAVLVHGYARRERFVHWLSASVAGLGLVAIVFETLPLFWFARCTAAS